MRHKDWSEPVSLQKIAGMCVCGGTPLSPAILAAAQELLQVRDVQRRILIPLTDGGCNMGSSGVKAAVRLANHWGVEVGALGIGGGTEVEQIFPIGVDLPAAANVTAAGLDLLVTMLEKGANKAA